VADNDEVAGAGAIVNRDFELQQGGQDGGPDDDSYLDETLPGASATAGKLRIPTGPEAPSSDMLQEFAQVGEVQVGLESLVADAAKGDEVGVRAVLDLAAMADPRVPGLLLKIHRGTRDFYGRIQETALVREAAAKALAAHPQSFALMLSKIYNGGKPLEKNEAIHVVARHIGPEGTKALIYAARQNALKPTGPESVNLARIAIQYLGEREGSESLNALLALAKEGVSVETRAAAVTALGWRSEPEAMQMVRDRVHNDPDRLVRIVAARALN
jgi:HEAT repeat protein